MDKGYMDEMDEDDMLALEYEAEYDEKNNYKPLSKKEAAERVRLFMEKPPVDILSLNRKHPSEYLSKEEKEEWIEWNKIALETGT